jgi:hypothetical protein
VYLVFNIIGNLLTQDDQVRCFENAARHLTDDGVFVVECRVPTAPAKATSMATSPGPASGVGTSVTVSTSASPERGMITARITGML